MNSVVHTSVANSYRRFLSLNLAGLIVSGFLFAWLARSGTFDFWLSQQFYDPVRQVFPLEHQRALFFFGHTVLKKITVIGWMICIVLAVASNWVQRLRPWRRALWVFVVMAGATAQLVQSLKGASMHACPYDLAMYGGKDVWFPLFDRVTSIVQQGHCWPGGHASAGFGIIAGYFALREQQPRWARIVLITGLLLGSVMGVVQIVRGAHFLSHNLWSLWLTWAMCIAIDVAIKAGSYVVRNRKKLAQLADDPIEPEAA